MKRQMCCSYILTISRAKGIKGGTRGKTWLLLKSKGFYFLVSMKQLTDFFSDLRVWKVKWKGHYSTTLMGFSNMSCHVHVEMMP